MTMMMMHSLHALPDGIIKLWDVRMVAEITTVNSGKYPANKAAFDVSGAVSAVRISEQLCPCNGPMAILVPVADNLRPSSFTCPKAESVSY